MESWLTRFPRAIHAQLLSFTLTMKSVRDACTSWSGRRRREGLPTPKLLLLHHRCHPPRMSEVHFCRPNICIGRMGDARPGITLPLAMIQHAAPPDYSSRVALGECVYTNGLMWEATRENTPEAPPPTGTASLASDSIVSHCSSRVVLGLTLVVYHLPMGCF